MPCAIQSSFNKNANLVEGSKYLSLGSIPFCPVNPMATGIKAICPNKFHNCFPTLPLLCLPYCMYLCEGMCTWRCGEVYLCAFVGFRTSLMTHKCTHTDSAWCLSSRRRRNVTDMPLPFYIFKKFCVSGLCINPQAVVIV